MKRLSCFALMLAMSALAQTPKAVIVERGVELYQRPGADTRPAGFVPVFWSELERMYRTWTVPKPPFARSIAFLVGVSDYDKAKGFIPLPGVEKDLDHMRDFLLNKGGFDQVYVARKGAATRDTVDYYMTDFFNDKNNITADDRLLFYFSGHGDEERGTPFMLFTGATKGKFGLNALRVKSYEEWSDRILAKHAVFIFDACKAGDAFTGKSSLVEGLALNGSRIFVSAGSGDQDAWYSDGRSIFTDLFLQTLESGANDAQNGLVTIELAVEKTRERTANIARAPGISPMIPRAIPISSSYKGTFVFLNPVVKDPKLPQEMAVVLGAVSKGATNEGDNNMLLAAALASWNYIVDKHDELLYQQQCDMFPDVGPYCSFAKREIEQIEKNRPVMEISKLTLADLQGQADARNVPAMAELGMRLLDGSNGATKDPAKAKGWLEFAAKGGHADAAYRLGRLLYYGGTGVVTEQDRGLEWIEKAEAMGSGGASWFLGESYLEGSDRYPQDRNRGITFLQRGAARSDPVAINALGLAYARGVGGLTKDERKAVELYRRGADLGDTASMINLASAYLTGEGGLVKDEKKVLELYQKAADAGEANAIRELGVFYINGGGGLSKDDKKAIELFQKAADLGDALAMGKLGLIFATGSFGMPKDDKKGKELFQKMVERGDAFAIAQLGTTYATGSSGLPKDDQKAVELYQKAGDLGNSFAMIQLGAFYLAGRGGLSKDDTKAIELFQKAADAGDSDAMARLGAGYESGSFGLPKDEKKAVELYQKAADQGHAFAMARLGTVYANGSLGLSKDDTKAIELLQKAADLGQPVAMALLGQFFENGSGGLPKDERKAIELYQKAVDTGGYGSEAGMFGLGLAYELGKGGLTVDLAKAKDLYRRADQFPDAQKRLKVLEGK